MIENDFNELFGKEILESDGTGVAIIGRNKLAATGNVVGGDTPVSENEISFSGRSAILIAGIEGSQNEIARNHGFFNEESFIRFFLNPNGLEPVGPNGGIEPRRFRLRRLRGRRGPPDPAPTSGSSARKAMSRGRSHPFSVKPSPAPAGSGRSTFPRRFPGERRSPRPRPASRAAPREPNSRQRLRRLSSPSFRARRAAARAAAAGRTGRPPRADVKPPQALVTRGPRAKSRRGVAQFRFRSDEPPGSSFQCRLDGRRFRPCASPIRYRGLGPEGTASK